MAKFRFNEGENFPENCKAFLEAIKADDPETAAILNHSWKVLVAIVREGGEKAGRRWKRANA